MKSFELVKREDHYGLYNEDGHKIAATLDGCNSKLSKENCDEIFGVIDVETLSDEYSHDSIWFNKRGTYNNQEFFEFIAKKSFTDGFIKAMELQKDKLFTEFDIIKAFEYGWNQRHFNKTDEDVLREIQKRFIQSLQQPAEIEVEIVMIEPHQYEMCSNPKDHSSCLTPKLDKNNCLILKKEIV